jgi:protocatechuate 3,4-dioxygenase beta subunit
MRQDHLSNDSGLSRRTILRAGITAAAAWKLRRGAWALGFTPSGLAVCNTTPEQTVGPYYIAEELLRSDIREGKPGLPLALRFLVMDSRNCKPLPQAAVDVWHCDALGLYAGFAEMNPVGMGPGGPPPQSGANWDHFPGPPPGFDPQHPGNRPGPPENMGPPAAMKPTDELTFLRGIQFTDATGRVAFATVFPGFYMGRTNHIHYKVRLGGKVVSRKGSGKQLTYMEGHTSHVGQVFFPEEFTEKLMQTEPYKSHTIHRTTQAEDDIFHQQHGAESLAELNLANADRPEAGYIAELIIAVDPTKTPAEVGMGGPPPNRK